MFRECLIVEDQVMFGHLLTEVLSLSALIGRVRLASTVKEALALVNKNTFDLVFLDLLLPDGPPKRILAALEGQRPTAKVVVITSLNDPWQINSLLGDNVDAVIDKGSELVDLERVLKRLAAAEGFLGGEMDSGAIVSRLSRREREVFQQIGEGLSNKEIAQRLGISVHTVETHRKNIARKAGVSGSQLVREAVRFRENGIGKGGG